MPHTADPMDYQAFFDAAPAPLLVMDRDFVIIAANRAYLAVTGRPASTLIGRYLFEAYPCAPDALDDAAQRQLQRSLERVRDHGVGDVIPLLHYKILLYQEDDRPVFDDRYWSCAHVPVHGPDGSVVQVIQLVEDITALQRLKLNRTATRHSALPATLSGQVLRRAEQMQQLNDLLNAESRHLRRLFAQAPGFMCVLRGPTHVFELTNEAFSRLVGARPLLGRPVREALAELRPRSLLDALDRVFATGQPFVARGLSARLRRNAKDGGPVQVFVDLVCQPVVEQDGHVSGIFVQGHDITEQKQIEDELARYREVLEQRVQERTHKLSELAGYLQRVSEDERHRLARELHDELGSLLTAIKLDLSWIKRQLTGAAPAVLEKLVRALSLLDDGIAMKRRLIEDLRPSALRHLGLRDALAMLLDEQGARNGWQVQFDVGSGLLPPEDDAALALYRIAQEALTNVAKYAQATTLQVTLGTQDGWSVLTVRDDGVGFDPADLRARPIGHHGLIGMEQRVLAFGGEFKVRSQPGQGTAILARIPATPSMPPAADA
ncbi:PAS domain-containing protein [Chitiniphilus purpureus]|uniref:PAS domain-containing protein n=1 Tax=Chitiniphilus purpureus TaxID=2981137 RepID=A0ABY6DN06_9NEIS|nr:PAS domain-containing protein [Chitiniphilus sp. CD1]UXY15392.1 PAS domain-containing protein [Chitiniphilus sp. CD1]